jgi:membrane protein implicated in regulation of membrane protease activity
MSMDFGALVWLVVAIAAAIAEISIPHFGLIFVAVAAAVGAAAAALGAGVAAQAVLFTVTLVGSFVTLRPLVIKKLHGPGVPGRTEALLGRDGVVTEGVDPVRGTGRVNVGGQDWAARSGVEIETGARVTVVGADGIVLEVRRS